MQQFGDQVVVVTGGGAGIGRATCLRFANAGAAVVVAEINEETGARTAADIVKASGKSLFVQTDVSDESSVVAMVGAVTDAYGRIDILVTYHHERAASRDTPIQRTACVRRLFVR